MTVSWEERKEEDNTRKHAKYQELVEEYYEPIKVDCRMLTL